MINVNDNTDDGRLKIYTNQRVFFPSCYVVTPFLTGLDVQLNLVKIILSEMVSFMLVNRYGLSLSCFHLIKLESKFGLGLGCCEVDDGDDAC